MKVAMLVSNVSSDKHPGETGVAVLFAIKLLPLLFSPVITYILHGHFQDECKEFCGNVRKHLISRTTNNSNTIDNNH